MSGAQATTFDGRVRNLLEAVGTSMEPDELARFLAEPNALLGDRPPWDLLTDFQQSEFERVVELVRGLAASRRRVTGPADGPAHALKGSKEVREGHWRPLSPKAAAQ